MSNKLNKQIHQLLLSHGLFRFGRAAFDIFLSVLIWRVTGDIKTVAVFNIIYGLTHTSIFVGKLVNYKKYDKTLILGGGLLVCAFILLFIFPSFWTILLFGAVQEVSLSMMSVPRRVYSENLLHQIEEYQENRVGYLVIREVFNIGFGMTASFAMLILLADVSISSLSWLASLVVVVTLLQVWLLTSINYAKEDLTCLS